MTTVRIGSRQWEVSDYETDRLISELSAIGRERKPVPRITKPRITKRKQKRGIPSVCAQE